MQSAIGKEQSWPLELALKKNTSEFRPKERLARARNFQMVCRCQGVVIAALGG